MKFISFGYNCSVSSYLKRLNLIKIDSCFDNLITKKLSKVTELIRLKNQNWFVDSSLEQKKDRWHVMCNNFQTFSIHDIPSLIKKEEVISYLNNIKTNQLKNLLETIKKEKESLIILRSNDSSTKLEEIFDFYNEIKKIRQNKFKLCLFQENIEPKYSNENLIIFNIKLPKYNEFWIYNEDWNIIFKSFFNKLL